MDIKYNMLNLPEVIVFYGGNLLAYSYMADGRKVRDSYGSFPTSSSTPLDHVINNTDPYIAEYNDWTEDYYYQSGMLKRVTTPEGYFVYYSNSGYSELYTSKDHVGSIWQHWGKGGGLTTRFHSYYPSGILDKKPNVDYPFALGGKEFMGKNNLDEYFFGARTMYAIMNRFNQMDPLCEKYYSVSPYVYCNNNPVNCIDAHGRDWYQNNETKYYSWYDGNKEREGYTYIGEKGSVLGEFESIIDGILIDPDGFNTRSLYSEGFTFDIAPNDKGGLLASKERGWDFFDEFANGVGPEFSVLLSDHPYTAAMKTDKKVLQAQQAIANGETDILGQITNVPRKWSPLNVFGTTSMAKQFIGSYRYDAFTSSDGKALNNVISDSKSRTSLFLHLPFSNQSRSQGQSRAFSNTYQFYIWKSSK